MLSTALILILLIIPLCIDGQSSGNEGFGRIRPNRPRNWNDEQPEAVSVHRARVRPHQQPVGGDLNLPSDANTAQFNSHVHGVAQENGGQPVKISDDSLAVSSGEDRSVEASAAARRPFDAAVSSDGKQPVQSDETETVHFGEIGAERKVSGDVRSSDEEIERFNVQAAAPSANVAEGGARQLVPYNSAASSSSGGKDSNNVAPSANSASSLAPFVLPTFAPFVFPTVPPIAPSGPSGPAAAAPFVFPGFAPFPVVAQGVASSAGGSAPVPPPLAPAPAPFVFPTFAPIPAPAAAQGVASAGGSAAGPAAPAPFAFPTFAPFLAGAPGDPGVTLSPFAFPTFDPLTAPTIFPDLPGSTLFPIAATAFPPPPGQDYSYGYPRIEGQTYEGVAVGQPGNLLYIFCASCKKKK